MRHHRLIFATLLFCVLSCACAFAGAQVQAVLRVGMTVEDMDRSVAFYTQVLDFEKTSDIEIAGDAWERLFGLFGMRARVVRLRLGGESIELVEFLAPRGRRIPADSRSNDRWFQHIAIVTSDIDVAYARLRHHKVRHVSTGPQTLPPWNPNAGGIKAFYFHDPDGHVLEIIEFPPDKGDPRWRSDSLRDRLLLGIDHTAIVVRDTDKSLEFYRDRLGLKIAGESENFGPEQERLNNIFGARLRITTLRAPGGGPGIELLEYLAPRDGRAYPADARVNDLFHWHMVVTVPDADDAARLARHPGSTEVPASELDFARALLARDPDGHALLFTED